MTAVLAAVEEAAKPVSVEVELDALSTICDELAQLDKDAQQRVAKYVIERFGIYIPRD